MSSKLPVVSGQELVKAFESIGWQTARQRGSHIIMIKLGEIASLSVPNHKHISR